MYTCTHEQTHNTRDTHVMSQFRSLSSELYGSEEHHRFVRRLACEHMRSHRGDYAAFIGEGLEESGSGGGDHAAFEAYVQGMGADREW